MSRDSVRIKLHRMVAGQVKDYINQHPDHIHPNVIPTLPNSIAKRVANELASKGVRIDARLSSGDWPPTRAKPLIVETKKRKLTNATH